MAESITTPAAAAEIVAASEDAIIALTADGLVSSWNPAAEGIYGFDAAAMVGSPFDRLVPPELRAAEQRRLERAASGERLPMTDTTRVHRDGTRVVVSSSLFPIRDVRGRVTTIGIIERDVTRHRALEAELLQAKRVETVGRLARGAAQEVNNINTTILGLVDFVAARVADDPSVWRDLDEIRKQARRGSRLARHILSFSNRPTTTSSPTDVNDSLGSMESLLRRLVSERVDVVLDLVGAPTLAAAETSQVELVLFELVMRACDMLGAYGTIIITTRAASIEADSLPAPAGVPSGNYVEIAVRPVRAKSEVSSPAYTDLVASDGLDAGAMSLAMVSSVLQRVGGFLAADSRDGTMTVFLPATERSLDAQPHRRQAVAAAADETILLVEDEDAVRDVIGRALRSHGFHVLEARDGDDALTIGASHAAPIHLVISDVVMPHMDGRELFDRLRSWYPNIRFLFVSGYASGAIGTRELRSEMTEFLPKPFTTDTLHAVVRTLLDRRRS